jgi:hypothetical protein
MAYSTVFPRIALGISFLSAVADRFGLWATYGQLNVAWGEFSHFVQYTGKLNWFAATAMIPVLAWAATFRGDFGCGTRLRIFHASCRTVEWIDAVSVRIDNDFRPGCQSAA